MSKGNKKSVQDCIKGDVVEALQSNIKLLVFDSSNKD